MPELTIGRNEQCDIVISDPTVSRKHATLIIGDPKHTVRDEGSANGTFINGSKITDTATLNENDILKVGNTVVPWKKYIKNIRRDNPATPSPAIQTPTQQTVVTKGKKKKIATFAIVSGIILILLAALVIYFFYISQKDELRISASWTCDDNCGQLTTLTFTDNEDKTGDYKYVTKNAIFGTTAGTYYINVEDKLLTLSLGLLAGRDSLGVFKTDVLYKYKFWKNTLSLSMLENGLSADKPIILIKKR